MKIAELKNKKIAILGYGKEGKDTESFLLKLFPEKRKDKTIVILDEKIQGKSYLSGVGDCAIIFRTPGIPLVKIKPHLRKGQVLTSQTELFFDNCQGKIIGVTGTKGKGTTATLIYKILKKAGKNVYLVGNIGKPVLGEYLKVKGKREQSAIFIYELSSHQLQGLKKSPQIAVFLNLFPDHLDYYKNIQEYFSAKKSIAKYQIENDIFIFNATDKQAIKLSKQTKAKKVDFTQDKTFYKTGLTGDFNQLNIKAAVAVTRALKTPKNAILSAIKAFRGLEHRLQFIGKYKGISFYNDSLATLPEVTVAALKSLPKTTVLIVGGSKKGSNYQEMAKAIRQSQVKTLIILGEGTGQEIVKKMGRANLPAIISVNSMREAVKICFTKAKKGEVCLLSPGAASFNLFKSYQDRGEQFIKWIKYYGQKRKTDN